MRKQGIDLLFVSPSSDLVYLIGHHTHVSERLTLFVLPAGGSPLMVVPELEAPLARSLATFFSLHTWPDGRDPYALVASLLPAAGTRIAVSDQLWSMHLLHLQATFPKTAFGPASSVLTPLRRIKDASECAVIRRAGAAVDATVTAILETPLVGRTESEIARRIEGLLIEKGHDQVAFAIVASGPNSGSPHHVTSDRRIAAGDAVMFDIGGTCDGYYSDITRTVFIGEPPQEFVRVYDTVRQAQEEAFAAIRPGLPCQEIDRAARRVISAAGYGEYFIHRTGHGLGLDGHEEPNMVEGNTLPLAQGMVFSVEPGVYLPGRFGVRIEDIAIVTERGAASANHLSHDMQTL